MSANKKTKPPKLPKGTTRSSLESMIENAFSCLCNSLACDNTSPCVACAVGKAEEAALGALGAEGAEGAEG